MELIPFFPIINHYKCNFANGELGRVMNPYSNQGIIFISSLFDEFTNFAKVSLPRCIKFIKG
jgi:hypothetical protein